MCKEEVNSNILERLETIAAADPNSYTAHNCQGIALLWRKHFVEALAELDQALLLDQKRWDAHFWKGMTCAFLRQDEEAITAVKIALDLGLPPILLAPLHWLEQERPDYYEKYIVSILAKYV